MIGVDGANSWIDLLKNLSSNSELEVGNRLQAVAHVLQGETPEDVAFEADVPTSTVKRWFDLFRKHGEKAVIDARGPTALPLDTCSENLAAMAAEVRVVPLKTALHAISQLYRGSTVREVSEYYCVSEGEIEDWISAFSRGGKTALSEILPDGVLGGIARDQIVFGRRPLPALYDATFLRNLMAHSAAPMARRLLVVVLAYEGRTLKQIADWLGLREHIVSGLVRAFIRNGHHGLALQARFGRPPYNSSYGASRVQRLADAAQNEAYRIRLEIIAAAYRGVPWRDIGETYGTSYRQVEKFVRLFEADGPVALSYGEALLTPSLRSDYDGKLLRKLAGMESDPTVSLKIASIARLYDGETMYDVAKSVRHVGTLSVWLSSFQREGHTFAAPFEWLTQTPLAPPSRLPALREDLAADVIRPYAESATRSSARRLGAVLDYATGMNQSILLEKWQVSFTNMKRWIIEANQEGLAWFYLAQPKEWLRKHSADLLATGITPVDVATRLGKSTEFVLESATAMPEVESILGGYANDVSIMGQVRLAMRSHLEPLAS